MRFFRRRLGLTQRELADVLGYDSDSQISRIENGSRMPQLSEVLVIELVFGVPGVAVFPEIVQTVGRRVCRRVRQLIQELKSAEGVHSRAAYKTAQLERVLASLRSRNESNAGGLRAWQV
jgi:transcriptional regulator with XRE-family HTH domain